MNLPCNPQLQLAFDFVQYTNRNIFLTGKAGTGKTTFLRTLKEMSPKRMIVVAPTGVAAVNAGGVTIHSFFQMPFGPIVPGDVNRLFSGEGKENPFQRAGIKRFSREKINIIRSLDLLVIDEISMVRADLLDGVDEVLRRFRDHTKPFGGLQLLMIGDLQQLPPVIREDDWEILSSYYDTGFFFSSKALQQTQYISIELEKVYRQSDEIFIRILNEVRDNQISADTQRRLNERYIPAFDETGQGYIILTTHNAPARQINEKKLAMLPGKEEDFRAVIEGDFPEQAYPTDLNLVLKTGAQVMFLRNDSSPERLYYNGKIGTVTGFDEDGILVRCADDEQTIPVQPVVWENIHYSIDQETKEIKEQVAGTFTQYPLKLAWAITIHKSQGLTFDKAVIDARAAFAHGQVYVALSRCRNLEGLVLSTPLPLQNMINDSTVTRFTQDIGQNQPDQHFLDESKRDYMQTLLHELFDFSSLDRNLRQIVKLSAQHAESLAGHFPVAFREMQAVFEKEISDVSAKFLVQLHQLMLPPDDRNDAILQERIGKASSYFLDRIESVFRELLEGISVDTDNRTVRKALNEALEGLLKDAGIKIACLKATRNGFILQDYLAVRARAFIEEPDIKAKRKKAEVKEGTAEKGSHPLLYARLKAWRDNHADEAGVPVYMILPRKTMEELARRLPCSLGGLESVKGLGQRKIKQFGEEIVALIQAYCTEKVIEPDPGETVIAQHPLKKKKGETKEISLALFREGKTIEEIAAERGMTVRTVEGHLAYFVGIGEMDVYQLMPGEKVERIRDFFIRNNSLRLGPAKEALGDSVTYGELLFVQKSFEAERQH